MRNLHAEIGGLTFRIRMDSYTILSEMSASPGIEQVWSDLRAPVRERVENLYRAIHSARREATPRLSGG